MEVRVQAEEVMSMDLQPGDLFSTAGPGYWRNALDYGSIGERVYIRTNVPCPVEQEVEPIFRITIELDN